MGLGMLHLGFLWATVAKIGRTPDGQFGGGSIVEYRNDRMSSQVFVIGAPVQHPSF
jgi:hypothetical protein